MIKDRFVRACNKALWIFFILYSLCAITTTSGIEITSTLLILFWLARSAILRSFSLKDNFLTLPVLFFTGVLLFSCLFSIEPLKSIIRYVKFLGQVGLFFVVLAAISELKKIERLLHVLLISVFLATIFGIWQFVFKIDVFNHGFHYIGEYVRVQSTQDAPNAYGSCLAMVLPICMCLFAFERTTWKKILFAILILLIFSNILLSFSRGAIISTFFALFAVAFISKNRVLMNIFALAITIGVLMFACYGLGGFQKELISRFKVCFNPKADLTRVYLFKSAWEIFKDKPLFGSGFGTFKKIYWDDKIKAGIPPETIPGGALNSCHNNLLQIACETGLFSLIGFLWVIGLFFYRSISFYRRNKDILEGYLVLGIIGAVIAFFVHGMVDYTFGLVSTSHLFWYFLGVVAFIIGKDINKKI